MGIEALDALPADIWSLIVDKYLACSDLVSLRLTGHHGVWKILTRPGVVKRLSVETDFPASKAPYKFLIGMPNLKHMEMTLSNTSTTTQRLMAPLSRCLESLSLHWFPENYGRRWPGWSLSALPPSLITFRSNMPIYDSDLVDLPRSLTSLELTRIDSIKGSGLESLPRSLTHLRLSVTSDSVTTISAGLRKLSPALTSLELPYMSAIDANLVDSLPNQLVLLNLSRVHEFSEDHLKKLPRGLTHLNLKAATSITDQNVQHLPPKLTFLCFQPNEENSRLSAAAVTSLPPNVGSFCELPRPLQREYTRLFLNRQLPPLELTPTMTDVPRWVANNLTDDLMLLLPPSIRSLNFAHNRAITERGIRRLPPNLTHLVLPSGAGGLSLAGSQLRYLPQSLRDLDLPHLSSISDSHIKDLPANLTRLRLCVEETKLALSSAALPNLPSNLALLEVPSCYLKAINIKTALFKLPSSCQQITFGSGPAAIVIHRDSTSSLLRDTLKHRYFTATQIRWVFDEILSPLLSCVGMVLVSQWLFDNRFFWWIPLAIAIVPPIVSVFLFIIQRHLDRSTSLFSFRPSGSIIMPQVIALVVYSFLFVLQGYGTRRPHVPF